MSPPSRIDRIITLVVLAVLIGGVYLVLQPFLSAIVWAAILAATTWPLFHWLVRRSGRPGVAATVMTLLILMVVVAPFVIVGATLAENSDRLLVFTRNLVERGPPEPPEWLARLPLVGERATAYWASFAHDGTGLLRELQRLMDPMRQLRSRPARSSATACCSSRYPCSSRFSFSATAKRSWRACAAR